MHKMFNGAESSWFWKQINQKYVATTYTYHYTASIEYSSHVSRTVPSIAERWYYIYIFMVVLFWENSHGWRVLWEIIAFSCGYIHSSNYYHICFASSSVIQFVEKKGSNTYWNGNNPYLAIMKHGLPAQHRRSKHWDGLTVLAQPETEAL